MRNEILGLLMVAVLLTACNHGTVYQHYEHVPNGGWETNDTLSFEIGPLLEAGTYQEKLELRIDEFYPFLGLSLKVEQTIFPRGERYFQTLSCDLIEKNGAYKGNGISFYQYGFDLNDLHLEKGDSIHIIVRHNMKREIMPGVTDIGILLKKIR